jgi:hypothetical protein
VQIERRALDDLTPDELNARVHSKRNLQAIAASLQEFGQRRPVVVDADGLILAGNGLCEAARTLGWTEVDVTVAPDDWTPEQARAFAIADNRTADLADWNSGALIESLEMLDSDALLQAAGFSEQEFEDLIRAYTGADQGQTNPDDEWVDMPDYDQQDARSVERVIVHFMTHEDANAFFKMLNRDKAKYIYWPNPEPSRDTRQVDEWVYDGDAA